MSLLPLLPFLDHLSGFNRLIKNLRDGVKRQYIVGLLGSSRAYLVAGLYNKERHPILIITKTKEEAEELKEDLSSFIEDVVSFPSWEVLPYELLPPPLEITDLRLSVLDRLIRKEDLIIVAPIKAILIKTIPLQIFSTLRLTLRKGESINMEGLLSHIVNLGYERVDMVECKGEFSVRGGIIDLYSIGLSQPTRIEFFNEKIESIRIFDPISQRSRGMVNEVTILPRRELILTQRLCSQLDSIFSYLRKDTIIVLDEPDSILDELERINDLLNSRYKESIDKGLTVPMPQELFLSLKELEDSMEGFQSIYISLLGNKKNTEELDFLVKPIDRANSISLLLEQSLLLYSSGWRIVFVSDKAKISRIQELLEERKIESCLGLEVLDCKLSLTIGHLSRGFIFEDLNLAIITDNEILPRQRHTRRRFIKEESQPISSFIELKEGDLVVHINYGIGRYLGIKNIEVEGIRRDFLLLEYADKDRLYVPVDQLDLVQKYIGDKDHPPKIYRLGTSHWEHIKRKVKDSVRDMAKELLDLYAAREALPGFAFGQDTTWQYEFESSFRYEETPDQLRAIEEIKQDMEKKRPMDRLVCGDVGYGKTEVAMRAAFKAVMDNKQVAVLVPTTILAQQHLTTFHERFHPFPINIEMLSRFKKRGEQRRILEGLRRGWIDIIIGTHRLLQKDVTFYDLGLVIIDEEQRFGVRDKERLKNLKRLVDVLTLTATPIPRTMYMALTKTRDMSLITTPPPDRFPIKTMVLRFDIDLVRDAILREIERGGQVYFVHNQVETIDKMAHLLKRIVPHVRLAIAHGKMDEDELERVMLAFLNGEYDLLLATSIIESGLDIPRVNTIIIDSAHKFGLAQLYQLRGRVGRADHQAYAYLLYPPKAILSRQARERLLAIKEFSELGSGFRLAMRDMEIRGCGNILGKEQHGNLIAVGLDLYCRLLEEAVAELKGERIKEDSSPSVELGLDAYIPEWYIKDTRQRFEAYKRISRVKDRGDIREIREELRDRYGPIPEVVSHLLLIMEIKTMAKEVGITSISYRDSRITIELQPNEGIIPKILYLVTNNRLRLDPIKNLLYLDKDRNRLLDLIDVLEELVDGYHSGRE